MGVVSKYPASAGGSGSGITSLTGDVTATGPGAAAATIAAGAVSPTKLANIANNTVLGNVSGVASNPVALSSLSLQGLVGIHPSVTAVATANITLSGTQTIDGIAVVAGNRVLCAGQTTATQNGVYVVAAGAWSYAADWATGNVVTSTQVSVDQGTTYGGSVWAVSTTGAITVGTTSVAFRLIGGGFDSPGVNTQLFQTTHGLQFGSSATVPFVGSTGPLIVSSTSGNVCELGSAATKQLQINNAATQQGVNVVGARFDMAKGADIASASTLTLGNDGNYVHVTGTTGISFITTTAWQSGSEIALYLVSGLTLTHNASSPPANTAPMLLASSIPFVATAGSRIKLVYDSALAAWLEVSRVTS